MLSETINALLFMSVLIVAAYLGFVIAQKTQPEPVQPQPYKATVIMCDNGMEILEFDNATVQPYDGKSVKFSHMDTQYELIGSIIIKSR